jgi:hypothetical protein
VSTLNPTLNPALNPEPFTLNSKPWTGCRAMALNSMP